MSKASKLLDKMDEASGPKVGDECKADFIDEGDYIFGKITKIGSDGLTHAKMDGESKEFVGDTPTRKHDGVWVFDGF